MNWKAFVKDGVAIYVPKIRSAKLNHLALRVAASRQSSTLANLVKEG